MRKTYYNGFMVIILLVGTLFKQKHLLYFLILSMYFSCLFYGHVKRCRYFYRSFCQGFFFFAVPVHFTDSRAFLVQTLVTLRFNFIKKLSLAHSQIQKLFTQKCIFLFYILLSKQNVTLSVCLHNKGFNYAGNFLIVSTG